MISLQSHTILTNLCDYSDTYIVKGTITVKEAEARDKYNINLVLKNNAPFISCVSKINGTLTDNTEDLDDVMPM